MDESILERLMRHHRQRTVLRAIRARAKRALVERFEGSDVYLPAERLRFEFGFGFGPLYHPYVEALKLADRASARMLLVDFFVKMDIYLHALPTPERLNVQGWRLDDQTVVQSQFRYARIGHFHAPPNRADLETQADDKAQHLFAIRQSVLQFGYVPLQNGFASGVGGPRLPSGRLLVLGGQHRAAVLENLGWSEIPARYRGHSANIPSSLKRIDRLPLVARGVISEETARNVVSRIDDGFSRKKADELLFPFAG